MKQTTISVIIMISNKLKSDKVSISIKLDYSLFNLLQTVNTFTLGWPLCQNFNKDSSDNFVRYFL